MDENGIGAEAGRQPRAPAGWYQDPQGSGRQRWWDGNAWGPIDPSPLEPATVELSTAREAGPEPAPGHVAPAASSTWLRGGRLVAIIVVAVLLVVAAVVIPQATKGPCDKLADLARSLPGMSRNERDDHAKEFSDLLRECADAGGPLPAGL